MQHNNNYVPWKKKNEERQAQRREAGPKAWEGDSATGNGKSNSVEVAGEVSSPVQNRV